jgi:hypothetical protein
LLKAAREEAGIEGQPDREIAPHENPQEGEEAAESVPAADPSGELGALQSGAPVKKAARKRAARKSAKKKAASQ